MAYFTPVRIIARKTLRLFWERPGRQDAEQPLKAWFREAARADWASPAEIKTAFASASIVGNSRVVFNIGGNKYRLVVRVNYAYRVMYVRFIGTHQDYNKIDVEEVWPMQIKPIKSDRDHLRALKEIDRLMDARPHTPEGDLLDVLTTLVEVWEEKHHAIDAPDPVEAIRFVMEQRGVTRRDLEPLIGSRARVAEVLNHKRNLTLPMIRRLHEGLGIPAEALIREPRSNPAA